MEPENNNQEQEKPKDEVKSDIPSTNPPVIDTGQAPAQKFPEPKILEAVVDPNIKPKETPSSFSFTNPQVIQKAQAQPSKGDIANQQLKDQPKAQDTLSSEEKLKKLDEAIKRDEGSNKEYTYDDYRDTGEMFIEMWEGGLQLIGQLISKDSAPSAYSFLEEKKKKLIEQATKVSRKRNWVVPIEASFLGNLIPASARIVIKATDNRKTFMAAKRKAEIENREQEVVKGGPNKGEIKTRGPGRPKK